MCGVGLEAGDVEAISRVGEVGDRCAVVAELLMVSPCGEKGVEVIELCDVHGDPPQDCVVASSMKDVAQFVARNTLP